MTKDKYKLTIFLKINSWFIENYKDLEKFANYK